MSWLVPAEEVPRGTSSLKSLGPPSLELSRGYLVQKSFSPGCALFRVPMLNRVRHYMCIHIFRHKLICSCIYTDAWGLKNKKCRLASQGLLAQGGVELVLQDSLNASEQRPPGAECSYIRGCKCLVCPVFFEGFEREQGVGSRFLLRRHRGKKAEFLKEAANEAAEPLF